MYTSTHILMLLHMLWLASLCFPAYKLIDIMDHKRDHGDKMD